MNEYHCHIQSRMVHFKSLTFQISFVMILQNRHKMVHRLARLLPSLNVPQRSTENSSFGGKIKMIPFVLSLLVISVIIYWSKNVAQMLPK